MTRGPTALPTLFSDSRRLQGPSLWLDAAGAALEVPSPIGTRADLDALLAGWRERVVRMYAALGWRDVRTTARVHRRGVTLALTAPLDGLLTATSVNEWALQAAATALEVAFDHAALEEDAPPSAEDEAREELARRLQVEVEERATGTSAATAADLSETPLEPSAIPIALVTGSNGKTTTVRLIAAMLRAHGHTVGYCCTDGVFVNDERVTSGDFSGPEGARRVLRDPRVTAAVLETARGGLLRRGLIVPRADAAVITNIAADHFGDYGVDTLEDLARVKGVVARALGPRGVLVLNGEDATLRARPPMSPGSTEWFRTDSADELLPPHAEMPITLGGAARHNVGNAAAAAHAAAALGVPRDVIHRTLRSFGSENADNAGRLERFEVGGVRVWVDYAHNPHGLAALLGAARAAQGTGRLGLLLGQAGDRDDEAIRDLARAAWAARPTRIVLRDLEGYLRGRAPGEVPALLRAGLLAAGAGQERLELASDDLAGLKALRAWARHGDLLVLPVHALEVRERVIAEILALG